MAHRGDGLNDIYDNDLKVAKRLITNEGTINTTPVADTDIVNKKFVDDQIGNIDFTPYAKLDGSNQPFTGNIGIGTTPSGILHTKGSTPVYIQRDGASLQTSLILKNADTATDGDGTRLLFQVGGANTGAIVSKYRGGTASINMDLDFMAGSQVVTPFMTLTGNGDLKLIGDNKKFYIGAGDDASITYNGSNLLINPQEVGSGYTQFTGAVGVNTIPVGAFSAKALTAGAATVFGMYNNTGNLIYSIASDSSENGYVRVRDVSGTTKIELDSAGVSYFNGGNVGIGGIPTRKLSVVDTTGACWINIKSKNTDKAGLLLGDPESETGGQFFYDNSINTIGFKANNVEVFNITQSAIKLIADNAKIYFGAADDASITYDGTDFIINSSLVTASDLIINCGTDKTLELTETVYNDANVGGLVLRTGGTAPTVRQWKDNDGDNTGIYTVGFADGDQGSGSIEVPHDYAEGTDLVFHIHYGINDAPTGTDKIRFDLIYNVQRDGTTFVDATTIDSTDITVDTQYKTGRIDFTTITGTNFKIGDQFNFTIKRTTAVGDAFAGEVLTQTLGFHYQCDTMGSRQIGTK